MGTEVAVDKSRMCSDASLLCAGRGWSRDTPAAMHPPPAPARTQNAGVKHKEEPGRPERRRLQGWGGTSCSPEKRQDHVAVRRDSDSKGLRPTGWGTAPGVHPDTHAHRGWGSALPLWAPPVTGPGSRESAVATSDEQAFPEPQSLSHGTRFNQEPNPAARLT